MNRENSRRYTSVPSRHPFTVRPVVCVQPCMRVCVSVPSPLRFSSSFRSPFDLSLERHPFSTNPLCQPPANASCLSNGTLLYGVFRSSWRVNPHFLSSLPPLSCCTSFRGTLRLERNVPRLFPFSMGNSNDSWLAIECASIGKRSTDVEAATRDIYSCPRRLFEA